MGGWQIVKFPEEDNMVEVVPSSWIFQDSDIVRCYWPPTISKSKQASCIKSQQRPGADWKSYVAKVLSKFPYESFIVASQKAKRAQYTSGLESGSGESDNGPKRSRKRNPRYLSSDDESPVKTPLKKTARISPRTKMPTPPQGHNLSSQEAVGRVKNNLSGKLLSVSESAIQKPETYSLQAIEGVPSREALLNVENNLSDNSPPVSSLSEADASSSSFNTTLIPEATHSRSSVVRNDSSEVIRLLHIINGRVSQNNKMITALLTQVTDISTKNVRTREATDHEPNISLALPTKSDIELLELDSKMDDKTLKKFLVKKLVHVGGFSLKETIKRILPKIVEDEVLKEYSWIGGKGKKKFCELKLVDVIKDVCKQNPNLKDFTEKSVENVVAVFLTKATERCNRKTKDTPRSTL